MRSNTPFLGALCLLPLMPALVFPGIGVLVSFLIVLLCLLFVHQSRRPTLALYSGGLGRSILIGLAFGLAVAVGFDFGIEPLAERITGQGVDLEELGNIEGNLINYLTLLAIGLVFGGIVEELVFRGFVIGWGTWIFGGRWSIGLTLLSATIFGLSHLYQGAAGVITTGLIGLLFGLLYLRMDRKLLAPIVAHMTVNAYGITLLYLGFAD